MSGLRRSILQHFFPVFSPPFFLPLSLPIGVILFFSLPFLSLSLSLFPSFKASFFNKSLRTLSIIRILSLFSLPFRLKVWFEISFTALSKISLSFSLSPSLLKFVSVLAIDSTPPQTSSSVENPEKAEEENCVKVLLEEKKKERFNTYRRAYTKQSQTT